MKYQAIVEHYAVKASNMTLEEALHHITEMYMEQCGVSISLRTVIYDAGQALFKLLLEDEEWKRKFKGTEFFCKVMGCFHDGYTQEYDRYDITYLDDSNWTKCCDMVIEEYANREQKLQAFCKGIMAEIKTNN